MIANWVDGQLVSLSALNKINDLLMNVSVINILITFETTNS